MENSSFFKQKSYYSLLIQVMTRVLLLALGVLLARMFSKEEYGTYSYDVATSTLSTTKVFNEAGPCALDASSNVVIDGDTMTVTGSNYVDVLTRVEGL